MVVDFEKNYKNNLDYLRIINSKIAEEVEKTDISTLELVIEDNVLMNIKDNGENLYTNFPEIRSEQQVIDFLENPVYIASIPYITSSEHKNLLHYKYCDKIVSNSPIYNDKTDNYVFRKYNMINNNIPMMIASGLGSGYHLLYLISKTTIYNLILFEKDYRHLKLSLHLFDWKIIFEYFKRNGFSLTFIVDEDEEILSKKVLQAIRGTNTMFSTMFYNYGHVKNSFYASVIDKIKDRFEIFLRGWGFYDDEKDSLINTLNNIKNGYPLFYPLDSIKREKEIPVFVIASGPSIDNDIKFIKENSEKAIIISCGTALRILYKNNIIPDFHMEIERHENTYKVIKESCPEEYLKKVNFLALNVLEEKVTKLFKQTYLFFRTNDAGSSLTTDLVAKFRVTNPTVTNAAISILTYLSFDNIYLFGCDMGFKSKENHHSKDSLYNEKDSFLSKTEYKIHKENASNFGDEVVYTTEIFEWSKTMIEEVLLTKDKDTIFYNCSDGVKIKGTVPIHSKDLILEEVFSYEYKYEYLNQFFKKLDKKIIFKNSSLSNSLQDVYDSIDILNQALTEKIIPSINLNNYVILLQMLQQFIAVFNQTTISLIGTSLRYMSFFIYSHSLSSDNKNSDKINIFLKESMISYREFLQEVKKEIKSIEETYKEDK